MISRVYHFGFKWKPSKLAIPVALLHHDADVNVVTGPVNAALGKHKRVEIFR